MYVFLFTKKSADAHLFSSKHQLPLHTFICAYIAGDEHICTFTHAYIYKVCYGIIYIYTQDNSSHTRKSV